MTSNKSQREHQLTENERQPFGGRPGAGLLFNFFWKWPTIKKQSVTFGAANSRELKSLLIFKF